MQLDEAGVIRRDAGQFFAQPDVALSGRGGQIGKLLVLVPEFSALDDAGAWRCARPAPRSGTNRRPQPSDTLKRAGTEPPGLRPARSTPTSPGECSRTRPACRVQPAPAACVSFAMPAAGIGSAGRPKVLRANTRRRPDRKRPPQACHSGPPESTPPGAELDESLAAQSCRPRPIRPLSRSTSRSCRTSGKTSRAAHAAVPGPEPRSSIVSIAIPLSDAKSLSDIESSVSRRMATKTAVLPPSVPAPARQKSRACGPIDKPGVRLRFELRRRVALRPCHGASIAIRQGCRRKPQALGDTAPVSRSIASGSLDGSFIAPV